MSKWNRKLNQFLKKYTTPFTFAAGILTVLGYLAERVTNMRTATIICYLVATVLAGLPIFFRAITGLRMKAIGIEVLVSIAVFGALFIGEYSEAAIVTFLFQFGTYLEQRTLQKTRSAIRMLTEMVPATAWRLESQTAEPEEIDADEVKEDTLLLVKTGGKVAVDGIIEFGEGYLNEASINGESVPIHKVVGDQVYAGTILDSGILQMRATRVGEDTTFSKIIALVEEAQDAKSPVERFIDRFAKWYTPAVVVIAALVLLITRNLDTAITVLVLACPGALVIGAPVANVAGIGCGAKDSVLLKGGDSVTTFAKVDTFLFDKTGTLTTGHPDVTNVYSYTEDIPGAMKLAAALESTSDHPLAKAIVNYVKKRDVTVEKAVASETLKGFGVRADIDGNVVIAGSKRMMTEQGITLTKEQQRDLQEAQRNGASTVLISENEKILLLFAISDKIKDGAAETIANLKRLGIKKTVMLTGDNRKTAEAVAAEIGIDEVQAELLPENKLSVIQKMQREGRIVAFVGDGVNDSPALAAADTGIAMGGGTDVAVETSDVVLMRSNLESIPVAIKLAKRTVSVLQQNIVIAVSTVLLLLAGLFAGYIRMASGMFIHEASILVVILNAMRLLHRTKKS
ncbi:heavy metal translocating P-type ATPase [Caproicibacterium sp. BJN0003]|uniref:heavy metal translocating P-type ATPase n=1 Tax=Caproicibacterium sp. BJN0003 TaxID=2994078 RepID=UPI0022501388|nr:heavy metal translocating P-type ATPase [Caproicibacterium sp. BJN0003]UZT81618.1 heavy metal translocating P-type ATPase [Caproicibacterium sp. BJN0003]